MTAGAFKYAAFDLDGTLLDQDGKIDDDTVAGVRRLRSERITLFVVSGRSPDLVKVLGLAPQVLDLFEPRMVLRNGDIIWNWRTNTVESIRPIPDAVLPTLAHSFPDFVADTEQGLVASSRRAAAGHAVFYGCPRSSITVADGPPTMPAAKVTIYADPTRVSAALRGIDGCTFDAAEEGRRCSVIPTGSCKTVGLAELMARRYGQPTLDDVVAFGDGSNDACLLRCAGAGVAMAVSDPDAARSATIQLAGSLAAYLTEHFPAGLDKARGYVGGGSCCHERMSAAACARSAERPD